MRTAMRLVRRLLETALCILMTAVPTTAAQDPGGGRAQIDRALKLEASGQVLEAVEELRAALKPQSNLEPELIAECWYHMGRMFLSERVTPSGFLARMALD